MLQQTGEVIIKLEDILFEWIKGYPHFYVNKAFTPQCSCHKNMTFNAHILCECHQDGTKPINLDITILESVVQIYHSDPKHLDPNSMSHGYYSHLYPSKPNFFTELEALLPKLCLMSRK